MDMALTGSQAREGVAARLSLVRPALRSRGDDPDLAAGGPKRTERRGSAGRTVGGGSLNGPNQRLSHGPSTSHMPCGYTPMHTRKGTTPLHIRYSVCPSHEGVGSFAGHGVGMERA